MSPSEIDSQVDSSPDEVSRSEAVEESLHACASFEGQSESLHVAHAFALNSFSKPIHNENTAPTALSSEAGQAPETGPLPNETQLCVEIGRTLLSVEHMMNLRPGCVIRLDVGADEPVSVYSGERLIARGQLVLVNECFGVKITELVDLPQPNKAG